MARTAIAEFIGALLIGCIAGADVAADLGYLLSQSNLGIGLLVGRHAVHRILGLLRWGGPCWLSDSFTPQGD